MKNFEVKYLVPHFSAVLLFLAITLVFFQPLLQNKKLIQNDVNTWKGAAKEIVDHRERTGEEPLWTNSMFSGMPAYQISTGYPSNLFTYVLKALNVVLRPANYLFLYLIGFYILLLSLRISPWIAIAGAIAFAFSSYFIIILEAGHNTKASAIAFMAPMVAGVILSFRGKLFLGGAITAFFLALELKSNHLQITYYLLFILLIYGLFELISAVRSKQLLSFYKTIGVLVIAAMLAIGSNMTGLWVTYDYVKYTTRGQSELTFDKDNKTTGLDKDYATSWSYGVGETMTLLIPNFMGGPSQSELDKDSETYKALKRAGIPNASQIIKRLPMYWGTQPFTSGPVYVGAMVCFLFVLGLFIVKGKLKWWLLSATILSIMLAWGKNFMPLTELFLDHFPGYNKFRSVSMILVIAEFTIPLLAILALSSVFSGGENRDFIRKSLKYSFIIVGGIALLFALVPSLFCDFVGMSDTQLETNGFPMEALRADRANLLRSDAFRSFIFVLLTTGVLWMFSGQKLKKEYGYVALMALFLLDMWPINKRYLNSDNFITEKRMVVPYLPTSADMQILSNELQANPAIQETIDGYIAKLKADKKGKRGQLANITQEEMLGINFKALNENTNFRVMNLVTSTFNDASTSYYHKSIGGYHGAKLKRYQELIEFQISRNNISVLNMLNAKYFIVKGKDNQPTAQRNITALGNAWFVNQYKIVESADSEITALSNFDPRVEAIVNKKYEADIAQLASAKFDPSATIDLTTYAPNHLVYQSKTAQPQLAVFSEIYYADGWNAYIDGESSTHINVNYVLRAMPIPEGEHTIEFKFEPRNYATGEKISLAFSSLLLVLVAAAGYWELRSKQDH